MVLKLEPQLLQYFISHCRNYVVKNIYNFDENDDRVIKYCVLQLQFFLRDNGYITVITCLKNQKIEKKVFVFFNACLIETVEAIILIKVYN